MKNSKQSTETTSKPDPKSNWPSKKPGKPSGKGRDNSPPSTKK